MAVFLDTSASAGLYHQEKGTTALEENLAAEPAAFVSRIGVIEMHSVLAGLVRTKEIDLAAMELLRRRFRSDARKFCAVKQLVEDRFVPVPYPRTGRRLCRACSS